MKDLLSNGGILSISNGTLNIAGKYYAIGINNLSKFSISGGSVIVPSIGSTNTTIAPFQIAGAGSQFNMTGGSLIIPREGGGGAQNLGFVNTGTSGGSVTGGTLQIGSNSSPAAQIIQINSSFPVGTILVNSANVNASLLTNSLSVINNVVVNTGTLTANNLNISLGRNWQNNGGLFVPGIATVLFNGTSSQTIFKSAGETFNNVTFTNSGAKSLLSAITASNITINSGSNLDVSASNFQITCRGNFMNSGTYNARNGLVFLNGTTAQSIGGTSITDFYNLTLNNNAGASLANAENLNNVLTLNNGTFNTNGQAFTMISNALNTARIAQITGTGDIIGNVTVQRYAPGGYTGWALLGTPISSALTFQDWDDDMPISCATCPDGSAGGFISIYSYNESAAGSYSAAAGYVPMTGITNPITPNNGYWVYLGTGQTSTSPITIDVTGSVRKFNNTISLSKTNTGSPDDDGWNLIHNPYPSPISWAALRNGNANVDNAIYTYNADLNGGTGGSAAYVNGVSSPAVGAGGIGDVVPMCQGFYVHCSAATSLNASESNKVAGNPTFLKLANNNAIASNIPLLRLTLRRANFKDETVVYLNSNATNNFDEEYDAIKMAGQNPNAPSIRQIAGTTELQINGIDLSSSNFSIPILATTGYNGTYTISLQDFSNFPQGACINLYDNQTGTTTNLRTNNYVFNLTSTTTTPRFTLNITLNPLQITSNITQPQCSDINAGQIVAVGNNSGPWNYKWKDINGNTIKSSLNKTTADTLNNIIGGDYTVDINTVGQCDQNTTTFNINTIELPDAQFSSADTVDLTITPTIQFNNTSTNAQDFSWNFGDNAGTSTDLNPSYSYFTTGTYSVLLIATSSSGCSDSLVKSVVVINNIVTSLTPLSSNNDIVLKTLDKEHYQLEVNSLSEETHVCVTDNLGKTVIDANDIKQINKGTFDINLNDLKTGVYYINLYNGKTNKTFKVINN